jgi:hypothetical protein
MFIAGTSSTFAMQKKNNYEYIREMAHVIK